MSDAPGGPFDLLRGIRVLDLSRILAGPYAAQLLTDLGADVIKVERPGTGDEARGYRRGSVDGKPVSPAFGSLNAGKRSICLDLRSPDDYAILLRLVDSADVLIQNFRPGLAKVLGVDAETLMARNPRLVCCTVSGFGEAGPLELKTAVDAVGQAYGGLMGINGERGQAPARIPVPIADLTSGLNAVVAILGALLGRERTGNGAAIGVSLLESVVGLMSHHITEYLLTGVPMERMGSRTKYGVPNQAFQTADGYVMLSATNDKMWHRFVTALKHPELADDPRFSSQGARVKNETELGRELEKLTTSWTTADLIARLDEAKVPCAPVQTIAEMVRDPQVAALRLMATEDYMGSEVPLVAGHFRIDGRRSQPGRVPALGEHTAQIVEELGLQIGARHD